MHQFERIHPDEEDWYCIGLKSLITKLRRRRRRNNLRLFYCLQKEHDVDAGQKVQVSDTTEADRNSIVRPQKSF